MKFLLDHDNTWRTRFISRCPGNPLWYWFFEAHYRKSNTGARFPDATRNVLLVPRQLIARLLVLSALACALLANLALAEDQRASVKKIGVLWSGTEKETEPYWGAFVNGMRELGWVEGKTAKYIKRFDDGEKTRLPKLAAELVALGVDVIAVTGVAADAPIKATAEIPIVVVDSADPIAEGITKTLSRPVGNVTGVSWQSTETAAKRVELAEDLLPGIKRLAVLTDMGDRSSVVEVAGYRAAVTGTGIDLRIFDVRNLGDFPAAYAAIKAYRPDALIYPTSTLTVTNLARTARFAFEIRVPSFSEAAQYAEAGLLLTYGLDFINSYKRAAMQVDRILKGAKPANLPWEQPTTFELVVNLKTAKALGIKIPESIMVRATRIIR